MLSQEQKEQISEELATIWHNDAKMVKFCMNNSKYIAIDGGFIQVCDSKPGIDSTIYYDDEYESPGASKEVFINYNVRHNMPETFDTSGVGLEFYAVRHYHSQKNDVLMQVHVHDRFNNMHPNNHVVRKLTETEIQQINAAIEEVQEHYKKRLNTYYKRYSHKVYASGYWANR